MKNINKGTIARTVAVIGVLINQFLMIFGKEKLPFTEDEIYQGVSMILSVGATLWAWWKNNSFTAEAQAGDNLKNALKEGAVKIEDLKDDDTDDEDLHIVEEPTEE